MYPYKMKNFIYMGETFDTDEIDSITLVNNSWIKVLKTDGGSVSFVGHKNPEESRKEYEEIMKLYNDALEKRKKGEYSDYELMLIKQWEENKKALEKYYSNGEETERPVNEQVKKTIPVNKQDSLF